MLATITLRTSDFNMMHDPPFELLFHIFGSLVDGIPEPVRLTGAPELQLNPGKAHSYPLLRTHKSFKSLLCVE